MVPTISTNLNRKSLPVPKQDEKDYENIDLHGICHK
jgi:hypothetical protein